GDPRWVAVGSRERWGQERLEDGDRFVLRVLSGTGRDDLSIVVRTCQLRDPGFQASAVRAPWTRFAAICTPLPDPPMTTPSASTPAARSSTTAWAAAMQNAG